MYLSKSKTIAKKILNDNYNFSDEIQHQKAINAMEKDMEEIQNHLAADSVLVKQGAQEITVKVFPQ